MNRERSDRREPPAADAGFAELVELHWTTVFRLVYRLTGSSHDAEDLTQETFVRALDRFASFRPGTNARAWLLRIATNAFLDVRRKRTTAAARSLDEEPAGRRESPGRGIEAAELHEVLEAAITELPEKARVVFLLRAREGLSFREIAAIVSTTEETARWHMLQARKTLMELLDGKL